MRPHTPGTKDRQRPYRKEKHRIISLITTDAKNPQQTTHIPNLAAWLIYHEQMGIYFWNAKVFNHSKNVINAIHHINKIKGKKHMVILIDAKAFSKI